MKFLDDVLILGGLIVIISTTFLLSIIGGLYCLGTVLLLLGVWFIKYPIEKG